MKNADKVVKLLEQLIVAVKEESVKVESAESNRFKKLSDGWILDKALGLEWGPSSENRMNYKATEEYVSRLGGRLPTIRELHSLVDYEKRNPAIDTTFFGDTKTNDYYWTGTKLSGDDSAAWIVYLNHGSVFYDGKGDGYYVRPVRAS